MTEKVYFITGFAKIEADENNFPEFGEQRTFGFYKLKEDAIQSMHTNNLDIHEGIYNYAVIEEVTEGVHGLVTWQQWFKYNEEKDGFFEIEQPESTKIFTNFSVG